MCHLKINAFYFKVMFFEAIHYMRTAIHQLSL